MSDYTPLPTNLVDDELALSQDGKRTYNIVDSEGNVVATNVHFVDTSTYTTVGSNYGAEQINEQNEAINQINADLSANTFDTSVNLSSTPYLTPTAGYITVVSGTGYATARITDTNGEEVPITALYKDVQGIISTYVKAGFYLTLAGAYGDGYAKFTPII